MALQIQDDCDHGGSDWSDGETENVIAHDMHDDDDDIHRYDQRHY